MRSRENGWRLFRQHRFGILAASAVVALGLGFWGYLESAGVSTLDAAYDTFSLLAFNFHEPSDGKLSPALQLARFVVPAVAAFATFTALILLLEDEWHLLRARRRSGHIVVCGLGRRGLQVVRSIERDASRRQVVAIDSDRGNPNIKIARELGAIVLYGDATEADLLHAARVQRAESLIGLLPDDVRNAELASCARTLCEGRAKPLDVYCHVEDMDLVADLTSVGMALSNEVLELEWFSVPERAAKTLLRRHVEFRTAGGEAAAAPHLVVIGHDQLARAITLEAARQWAVKGADRDSLRLTIVDPRAAQLQREITTRYPIVSRTATVGLLEDDLRSPSSAAGAAELFGDATGVFVCADSDSEGLELGFAASRVVGPGQPVVVRLLVENPAFVELLSDDTESGPFRFFSIVEETCSYRTITAGLRDSLALAIHETYLQMTASGNSGVPAPAALSWSELDQAFSSASRRQADHYKAKLKEVGCHLRPYDGLAPPLEFEDDEVERLARMEHERWNSEKKSLGWVGGSPRDDQRKVHPSVDVAWEDLEEFEADKDRRFVAELPRMLASFGYEIYRA